MTNRTIMIHIEHIVQQDYACKHDMMEKCSEILKTSKGSKENEIQASCSIINYWQFGISVIGVFSSITIRAA